MGWTWSAAQGRTQLVVRSNAEGNDAGYLPYILLSKIANPLNCPRLLLRIAIFEVFDLVAGEAVSTLLFISALGIYVHAFFLSISLGLPFVIGALLYKWWRTKDKDYYEAVKTTTGVLGLNFALGAITGTLVEFGLVQAWPGSIFVIATFGFMPLALELIAFIGEIVILIIFIVTLGRVKPQSSLGIIALYAMMAVLSGLLITTANSWLNVPWGTGNLAQSLYPFLPQYGPLAADPQALVRLKVQFLTRSTPGSPAQALQDPSFAQKVGLTLWDPFVAFGSPYAIASMIHNVNAGIIVGMAFALAGYGYRFFKSSNKKNLKIIRAFLPILLVSLVLQPTVFGDFMGKMVAANQPTKFALMENAQTTITNPLISFLAYGDPSRPIVGFDTFAKACNSLGSNTLASTKLSSVCLSDLALAESRIGVINAAYYAKIAFGVLALVSLVALTAYTFKIPILSKIAAVIFRRLGNRGTILLLSILLLVSTITPASLGWFIRENGRKPWTVYGLLYPSEISTPVPINPVVLAAFTITFVVMAVVGIYGMYVVSTKRLRFIELLRKGAGVE